MAKTYQEHLEEKRKLADRQVAALRQPTPAMRLAFYHSALLSNWRIRAESILELDEAFRNNDFAALRSLSGFYNYLIAAVAKEMMEEVALRLAVEAKELDPEKYKESWWVHSPDVV